MVKVSEYKDINGNVMKEGDLLIDVDLFWDYIKTYIKSCNGKIFNDRDEAIWAQHESDDPEGDAWISHDLMSSCIYRKNCKAYLHLRDKTFLNNRYKAIKSLIDESAGCIDFEINFWRVKDNKGMLWLYEEIPKFRTAYKIDIELLNDDPLHKMVHFVNFEIVKEG